MTRQCWLQKQFRRAGVKEGCILPWFCRLLAWIVIPDRMLRWVWNSRFYDPLLNCYTLEGVRITRSALLALKHGAYIRRVDNLTYYISTDPLTWQNEGAR